MSLQKRNAGYKNREVFTKTAVPSGYLLSLLFIFLPEPVF